MGTTSLQELNFNLSSINSKLYFDLFVFRLIEQIKTSKQLTVLP